MGVLDGDKLFLEVEQLGLDAVQVLTQALESLGATRATTRASATAIIVNPSHPSYTPSPPSSSPSSPPHIPYNWIAACVSSGTRIEPSAVSPPILLNHWRSGYLHQPITLYVSVNLRRRVANEIPEEVKSEVQSSLACLGAIIVQKRSKADVMIVDRKATFFTDKITPEAKSRGRDWQRFGEREWADAVVREGKMLPLEDLEGRIMPGPEEGLRQAGPSSPRTQKEREGKAKVHGTVEAAIRHAARKHTDVPPTATETTPQLAADNAEASTERPSEDTMVQPRAAPPQIGTGDGESLLHQPPSDSDQTLQEQQVARTTDSQDAPVEAVGQDTEQDQASGQPPIGQTHQAAAVSTAEDTQVEENQPPLSAEMAGHAETQPPPAPRSPRDATVERLEEGAAERLGEGAAGGMEEGAASQLAQPPPSEPDAPSPGGDTAPINVSDTDRADDAQHDAMDVDVDVDTHRSKANAPDLVDDAVNAATHPPPDVTDVNPSHEDGSDIQQESRSEANQGKLPGSPARTAGETTGVVSRTPHDHASGYKQPETERTEIGPPESAPETQRPSSDPSTSAAPVRPRWVTANAAPIVNRPSQEDASPGERRRRAADAEEERRRQREDSFAEDDDADAVFFKRGPGRPTGKPRKEYTPEDDNLLCRYLAFYHPDGAWSSRKTFETMVGRVNKYPWVSAHTFQSWHQRFKTNKVAFGRRVGRLAKEGLDDDLRTRDERQKEALRARAAPVATTANGNAQPSGDGKDKERESELAAKRKLVELSDGEEEPRTKKDPPPLRLGRQRNAVRAGSGLIPSSRPRPLPPSTRPTEPFSSSSQPEQPTHREREPLCQPGPASNSASPEPGVGPAMPAVDEGTRPPQPAIQMTSAVQPAEVSVIDAGTPPPLPSQAAVEVTSSVLPAEQSEPLHAPAHPPAESSMTVEGPVDHHRSPSPPPAGQAVPEPQSPVHSPSTQDMAPSHLEALASEVPSEEPEVSTVTQGTQVVTNGTPTKPQAGPSQTSVTEHALAPPTPPPAATPADAAVTPRARASETLVPESTTAVGHSRPSAVADLIERRTQSKAQPVPSRRPQRTLATVSVPGTNSTPSIHDYHQQRRSSTSSATSTGKRRREPDTIAASPTVPPARRPLLKQSQLGGSPAPARPQSAPPQRHVPPPTLADRQRQFERGREIVNENMAQYKANIQKWLREFDITGEEIRAAVATVRARTDLGRSPLIFDEVEAVLAEKYGRV